MRILIVDDHPIVRSGLRRLFRCEPGIELQEAADGREALKLFREFQPDLVVLDLGLPGMGGLEVIGRLKSADPGVRILVLSMHHDAIYVTRALQAGAAGYVSKNVPPDQLLDAIRRVGAGEHYLEREIAQEVALASVRTPLPALDGLSPRDFEIMRLLGEGRSLVQIADAIGISYKTVANTCSQIKAKLGVARTADLIRIAVQFGIAESGAGASTVLR